MTTIAARDGVIAADTQLTTGRRRGLEAYTKIRFIEGIGLVGMAGVLMDMMAVLEAMEELNSTNIILPYDCDVSGCIVDLKGRNYTFNIADDFKIRKMPVSKFVATGSGADYAYGALVHGATAKEAVQAACKLDIHSGGKVQTLNIKDFL